MTEEALNTLKTKKSILNDIQKEKIQEMMLRSRSRYEDLGKKPTRFFLSRKRNYTSKVIHKLVKGGRIYLYSGYFKISIKFYGLVRKCVKLSPFS